MVVPNLFSLFGSVMGEAGNDEFVPHTGPAGFVGSFFPESQFISEVVIEHTVELGPADCELWPTQVELLPEVCPSARGQVADFRSLCDTLWIRFQLLPGHRNM
jgi:hypothetical protein